MPTALKVRGAFWIPDQPERRVNGELSADEHQIRVELDGSLQDIATVASVSSRYPLLHGLATDGEPLSLFRITQQGAHLSSRVAPRENLWIHHAIVGAHLAADATFSEIYVRMDHLAEWVHRTGIDATVRPGEVRITYKRPDAIVGLVPDGQVAISIEVTAPMKRHQAGVDEVLWLAGRAASPLPLSTLVDTFLFPWRELISFATATPQVIEEISLRTADVRQEDVGNRMSGGLRLFHQYLQPEANFRKTDEINSDDMIFGLADWTGEFGDLLNNWLKTSQRARPTIRAMFGLAYAPPRWTDTTAMIWAQAIETYHRDTFSGSPATEAARQRWERVIAACPAPDREWLELKLRHAYEPNLHQRINEVARRARPVIRDLLKRFSGFAFHLKEARNAYAHFGGAEGTSGLHHYRLAATARWVLTANLLLDLGFSESSARALVERNPNYAWLAHGPKAEAL